MAQKRRDSDISSELYFSVYGNNRKLKPQKIKAFALYKPVVENNTGNNCVVAVNETNDIFISFKDGSESKIFTFDKVFYSNISQDDFYSLNKSIIQDIVIGVNCFLILCKLPLPFSSEISNFFKVILPQKIITNVLRELLFFVNKDENKDCSLHVSYFEIHGNKFFDLLSEFHENKELQMHEYPAKGCIEIKGLTEKPLIRDKDIDELFIKKHNSSECDSVCCHSVMFVSLVRRHITNEKLEFIKVGKLTLVGPIECRQYLGDITASTDSCLLNFEENNEFSNTINWNNKILHILKPAFGEKATTTMIVFLSSVLYALEKDLRMLQFASDSRNIMTNPEIDLQLIIRNSIKEYGEEIKELQKDFDVASKTGNHKIDHLLYRSFKNAFALENEKVKNLSGQVLVIFDSMNLKKQQIISLHTALELKESEMNETEKLSKTLKQELEEMENEKNNIEQKVSFKADEIISIKKTTISNELHMKKLKLQLKENCRNYEELIRSIHFLKNETTSLLCKIDAEYSSQKNILKLLIVDMNNTFTEFQHLEMDLTAKLNNLLLDTDVLITTWKNYMENLISKISSFIHKKYEDLTSMEFQINISFNPHESTDATVDLQNILNGKGPTWLKYYYSILQVSCDSSLKLFTEIIHEMDIIENCFKAEFKAIVSGCGSINEEFKKFVNEINATLLSFQNYFAEQEKELLKIADMTCFRQKFNKRFGEKIYVIRESLLDLKQIYLNYNDVCFSKWDEIRNGSQKTLQRHNELSDHLSLFQTEIPKYLNNLPQENVNVLEYSPLKDKANNIENQIVQLLQIHKEMKGNLEEACSVHKTDVHTEFLEREKYMNFKKTEVEKYFDVLSSQLKTSSSNFVDELRSMHENSPNNEDKFIRDLDSLLLAISHFESIFKNYLLTSSSILAKSERYFKVKPPVSEDRKDDMPGFENLFLEEWKVTTSTPKVTTKKELNVSKEKEKLIDRIKSLAEQQIAQKPNTSFSHFEDKETKNISTVSLPVFRTLSKAPFTTEKSFPRFKQRKK